jgi:hypothetical protein
VRSEIIPDHLPPGATTSLLDSLGRKATSKTKGVPFSADFVGDSKYMDAIKNTAQVKGFLDLARHSDRRTLVFYVRWQDRFPAPESLSNQSGFGALELPPQDWNKALVPKEILAIAKRKGVTIQLVSDPKWR